MLRLALSFLVVCAASACAPGDLAADADPLLAQASAADSDPAPVVHVDDWATRGGASPARPGGPLPTECQGLQEAATTVLGAYQHCSADADCSSQWVNAMCLGSFLCPVAVSASADLKRLQREASALSFAYRRACTTSCAVASCAAPTRNYCDQATRRCKSSY